MATSKYLTNLLGMFDVLTPEELVVYVDVQNIICPKKPATQTKLAKNT